MADSIRERILANIIATLKAIVDGDTSSSGFTFDETIREVIRFRYPYPDLRNFPSIMVMDTGETQIETATANQILVRRLEVNLDVIIVQPNQQVSSERVNNVIKNVEAALLADVTRGGIAVDTHLNDNRLFFSAEGAAGILINSSIDYRTDYFDPTVAR